LEGITVNASAIGARRLRHQSTSIMMGAHSFRDRQIFLDVPCTKPLAPKKFTTLDFEFTIKNKIRLFFCFLCLYAKEEKEIILIEKWEERSFT
jgi:hypothetical protein